VVADYLMPARCSLVASWEDGAAVYHSALSLSYGGRAAFRLCAPNGTPRNAAWTDAEERLLALGREFDVRVSRAAERLGVALRIEGVLAHPVSEVLNILLTTPELEPGLLPVDGQ